MTSTEALHSERPRWSMRLRLTLWAVAIFAVIQVTLALVLLLYYQQSIKQSRDAALHDAADRIRQELIETAPDWSIDSLEAQIRADYELVGAMELAILAPDGSVLLSSAGRRALDGARSFVASPASAQPRFIEFNIPRPDSGQHESQRAWTERIRGADAKDYDFLIFARSASIRPALRIVAGVILLFGPIGVLAAGVAGWYLAGVAVHPILQLQSIARQISPQSIDNPIDLDSSTTEVAKLREELDSALHRLDEGYVAQSRFLANVSHELRTPISVLLSEAEGLRRRCDVDIETREFVDSVIEEMKRLGKTIESFLLLSRVREKAMEPAEVFSPCNDLVMDSFEACFSVAEHYDVTIRPILIEDDDELLVKGDPELLRTMIDNVVRNAIRFSPTGGTVDLKAARLNGDVRISVRDHGPGMPAELMPRIFDRYVQAEGEKRQNRGIGLGLAIAQGIAQLHGGEIQVQAAPGGGCEVAMTLPVVIRQTCASAR